MIYRFQLRQNPRVILLPVIPAVLVGGSIALLVLVHPLLGLVALGISGYIAYQLLKFLRLHIKSEISTYDDELVCVTSLGEKSRIDWESVSHAGFYLVDEKPELLFVYSDSEDQLLTIPFHYTQMKGLENEISEHVTEMLELSGVQDGLVDVLKQHMGIADEDDQ